MEESVKTLLFCSRCGKAKFSDEIEWVVLDKNLKYYLNSLVANKKAEKLETLCKDCEKAVNELIKDF